MINLFTQRKAPGQGRIVKGWISEHFCLTEDDLVTLAELTCHEPGCPPVETVLTVHQADGRRQSWRVHKLLSEILEADIKAVLSETDR